LDEFCSKDGGSNNSLWVGRSSGFFFKQSSTNYLAFMEYWSGKVGGDPWTITFDWAKTSQ
jgi:hypothetical protein